MLSRPLAAEVMQTTLAGVGLAALLLQERVFHLVRLRPITITMGLRQEERNLATSISLCSLPSHASSSVQQLWYTELCIFIGKPLLPVAYMSLRWGGTVVDCDSM